MLRTLFKHMVIGLFSLLFSLSILAPASAAIGQPPAGGCDGFNPADPYGLDCGAYSGLTARDPRLVASRIINVSLSLLGILATSLIVFAGYKWMTAGGEEDKIHSAQQMIFAAIVGLIIIFSAYTIAYFALYQIQGATR